MLLGLWLVAGKQNCGQQGSCDCMFGHLVSYRLSLAEPSGEPEDTDIVGAVRFVQGCGAREE